MNQKKPSLKPEKSLEQSVSEPNNKNHDDDDDDGITLIPGMGLLPQSTNQDLRDQGIYYITGEIRNRSFLDIHQDILLKHIKGPEYFSGDLTLVINSPGGSVSETFMLLDLINNTRFDFSTVGLGQCCSCGAMLLAAGTKGKRMIGKNAMVMVHGYSWGSYGTHHDLVASRHAQDSLQDQLTEFWIKHSKYKTKALVEQYLMQKNDTWFTAKEAVEHGIVDFIGDCPVPAPKKTAKKNVKAKSTKNK